MKKLTFAAVAAVASAMFVSCGNSTPKANLKSDIDTVSYAFGVVQGQGLKDYITRGMGIDSTNIDEFVKGFNVGVNSGDDKEKEAYYIGVQMGIQLSSRMVKAVNHDLFGEDSTKSISMKNLLAALVTSVEGGKTIMTPDQAQMVWQTKSQAIKAKAMEQQYGENKKAGAKFLADYAKQPGVKKLDGGVLYKVIKEGKGEMPKDTSMVRVHYEGKTIDGKVFDSSYKRKEPVALRANQVIPGWTTALTHMPVGSTWEVVIPYDKAYGAQDTPQIKPFSTLIFKIELVGLGRK